MSLEEKVATGFWTLVGENIKRSLAAEWKTAVFLSGLILNLLLHLLAWAQLNVRGEGNRQMISGLLTKVAEWAPVLMVPLGVASMIALMFAFLFMQIAVLNRWKKFISLKMEERGVEFGVACFWIALTLGGWAWTLLVPMEPSWAQNYIWELGSGAQGAGRWTYGLEVAIFTWGISYQFLSLCWIALKIVLPWRAADTVEPKGGLVLPGKGTA